MHCKQHGEKIVTAVGEYRMCKVTGLPCPHHGIMTFHEETKDICSDCFFVDELFKIDPELTRDMEEGQNE